MDRTARAIRNAGWREIARGGRMLASGAIEIEEGEGGIRTSAGPVRRIDLEGFAREMEDRIRELQAEVDRLSQALDGQVRSSFLRS